MTEEEKTAFEAAGRIRDRLRDLARERLAIRLPIDYWQEITKLARQIEIARARGWLSAARSLRTDLARAVDYCRDRLAGLFVELDKDPTPIPTLSTLYHEILGLYEEFEDVERDLEEHELRVTTEPITLEGISLGRFQIQLDWERLGVPSSYYIKALDPNPAAANDGVTHPHVQDERLCEGDGRAAIQQALTAGRLGDFFLLVTQILRTYGKGSAYVELDDWDGVSCSDCGQIVGENERYYCERCDATLCDGCDRVCCGCDRSFCSGCLESCALCDESFCSSCLKTCNTCHNLVCDNCLTNGLCEKCHEKLRNSDEHEAAGDKCDGQECDTGCEGTIAAEEAVAAVA
jgi:hypothetical protein